MRRALRAHSSPNSLGARSRNRLIAVVAIIASLLPLNSSANDDKVLQNVKGVVRYETGGTAAHDVAPKAMVAVGDHDIVSTGTVSLGSLTMPDSSVILLGQQTRVEVSGFRASDVENSATFVVYDGKTRFDVHHPSGAKANYIFKTPVGEIGVRGTYGDISVDPQDGMRLNVYTASAPVTLDTIYGEHFSLKGGEKVWVRWQNGKLVGRQTVLSKAEVDRFAEFGPPTAVQGGPPK